MASYSQSLRVANCIRQDTQEEAKLYHKVIDLSHNLPLALFEGSRRKEDFHKALKEAAELLDDIESFKDVSGGLKSPQCLYSVKVLNNLLLMSISYHCRILVDNFSQSEPIHSNNAQRNSIQESEIETGYLLMKDMANTLLSVFQQCDVAWRNYLTINGQEEMLGLLLQAILRLNTIRVQTSNLSTGLENNGLRSWPRRCWSELGCPLMKMASSLLKSQNRPSTTDNTPTRQISAVYLSSVLKSLTHISDEDVEINSSREILLAQLKQRLFAIAVKDTRYQSQESHAFKEANSRKREACNSTVSYPELDHRNLDINTVLGEFFGLAFPSVDLFWSDHVEADGTEEIESTLMKIQSKKQLQDLISMLLSRISSSNEVDGDLNDTHLSGIVQTSREAVRVLLPILYVLLTRLIPMMIPRDDLLSICKAVLVTAHDSDIVNRAIDMSCRLITRIAQTYSGGKETDIYNFIELIDCISHIVSVDPTSSFQVLNKMLSAFRQMSISYSHDGYLWLQLTRKPHLLTAIVRACSWPSLHSFVIQVLWILSDNPGNHRSVARHPGVLASMIRIARENPAEASATLQASGITIEAWKGRIMTLADIL